MRTIVAPLLIASASAGAFGVVFCSGRPPADRLLLRGVMLKAAVVVGLLTVTSVETLSAFAALRADTLALFWAVVTATGWAIMLSLRVSNKPPSLERTRKRGRALRELPPDVQLFLTIGILFAGLSLVTAVATPPNNWDSMTYHMPRVAHWLENASVRHYPTADLRQLIMPPLSGYAVATIQSLAATDRWANVINWLAYCGGAVAASVVAQRIGGTVRHQVLAALVFLTIPMAVLQASTTQTDLMVSFWLLVLLAFIFGPLESWADKVWAGTSLGLALLAKPTALFFGCPLALLLVLRASWQDKTKAECLKRACLGAAAVSLPALLLVAPHGSRNVRTFGNPVGVSAETGLTVNSVSRPSVTLSNALRQVALHLPVPGYARLMTDLHRALGLDPSDHRITLLEDPRNTFMGVTQRYNGLRPLGTSEDSAGNPLHFLAGMWLLGSLFRARLPKQIRRPLGVITLAAFAGLLLMFTTLKWQPYGSRLDLPFFCLLSVPLGMGIASLRPWWRNLALASLILGALPALLLAFRRPLVNFDALAALPSWTWAFLAALVLATVLFLAPANGQVRYRALRFVLPLAMSAVLPLVVYAGAYTQRHVLPGPPATVLTAMRGDLMFRGRPELAPAYTAAAQLAIASGCKMVGLELRRDDWEYPLLVLLGAASGNGSIRVQNVAVKNVSSGTASNGFEPCVAISTVEKSAFEDADGWFKDPISTDPYLVLYSRAASCAAHT